MATSTTTTPTSSVGVPNFFSDSGFDFAARIAVGHAAQGVMDLGQALATIARIADGDADSWYDAWRATADKLHRDATSRLAAGHIRSARWLFLAASESYDQANSFFDGMTDQTAFALTFALHRQCWEAFVDATGPLVERVAVPYEGITLPGYLFRPDPSLAPRPTLIMTNGSDGALTGVWASGASEALARGWNVFLYDGPGQQTMLFDRGIPFRSDWETVLTPVVDRLISRPDVDGAALFAYGTSQAGYWVARALAFEQRFAAAVVDPGVVDVATSWLANLPSELVDLLKGGQKEMFNAAMAQIAQNPKLAQTLRFRSRPYGKATLFDTFTAVLDYNLYDVLDQIVTPLLILDPEHEQFWPGQPQGLYQRLTGDRELVHFASADGDDWHCEPLGRWSVDLAMFDFFEKHLAKHLER